MAEGLSSSSNGNADAQHCMHLLSNTAQRAGEQGEPAPLTIALLSRLNRLAGAGGTHHTSAQSAATACCRTMHQPAACCTGKSTLHLLQYGLGLLLLCKGVQAQVYTDSIFSFNNSYPVVWWTVSASDRPTLANNAVKLRSDTYDPQLFARSVIVSLASGQRNVVGCGCGTPPAAQLGSAWKYASTTLLR